MMYGPALPAICPKHKNEALVQKPDTPWYMVMFAPNDYCRKCKKVVL